MPIQVNKININCDMGEGVDTEAAIMPFISSCSIACGGHTGNRETMLQTVDLAVQHNVAIGAHPSYPDRANFGRKKMHIDRAELFDSLSLQINDLQSILSQLGVKLRHIKPHGALYNDAAVDEELARLIVDVVKSIDTDLVLLGLANSLIATIAVEQGIQFQHEVFIDRHYKNDGTLLERSHADAVLNDIPFIIDRVNSMWHDRRVTSWQGDVLRIQADTYCLHSDHPKALQIATALHTHFLNT